MDKKYTGLTLSEAIKIANEENKLIKSSLERDCAYLVLASHLNETFRRGCGLMAICIEEGHLKYFPGIWNPLIKDFFRTDYEVVEWPDSGLKRKLTCKESEAIIGWFNSFDYISRNKLDDGEEITLWNQKDGVITDYHLYKKVN